MAWRAGAMPPAMTTAPGGGTAGSPDPPSPPPPVPAQAPAAPPPPARRRAGPPAPPGARPPAATFAPTHVDLGALGGGVAFRFGEALPVGNEPLGLRLDFVELAAQPRRLGLERGDDRLVDGN